MSDVKPIPDGYTAITPYLVVEGAADYIDFLVNAFGAVERLRVPMPGNLIGHAEVVIDGAAIMLSDAFPPDFPAQTAHLHLYVEDVDAAYARAVSAGATSDAEPADKFYGERMASVTDPCGVHWTLATHIEDVNMDTMMERMAKMEQG